MSPSPTLRIRFRPLMLSAVVVAAALLLTGCTTSIDGTLFSPDGPGSSSTDLSGSDTEGSGSGTDGSSGKDGSGAPAAGAHQATLMMAGQSFTFAPTTCENADDGLRVSGPGSDDGDNAPAFLDMDIHDGDNAPAFLDMDIGEVDGWPAGKVFVYLNAKQAAPSGTYFEAEVGGGDDYSMGHVLDGYEVEVNFKSHAEVPIGPGSFMINCG